MFLSFGFKKAPYFFSCLRQKYLKAASCITIELLTSIIASAESYLNECLASYQSIHGPNHEKTLKCQDELARLMIRTDRAGEAIEVGNYCQLLATVN